MKRLALATCKDYSDLTTEDRLLVRLLPALEVEAVGAVWNDPAVEWRGFDGVVIRSCWDYHIQPEAFLAWVDRLDQLGVPVWNPSKVVNWNHNKSYLLDLQDQQVSVVPTRWFARHSDIDLLKVVSEENWDRAVVKPAVSASAYRTWTTSKERAYEAQGLINLLVHASDILVQSFVDTVETHGEWSLIFIDGAFSHAVIKRSGPGEFRVQEEFGGTTTRATPPNGFIDQARQILSFVDPTPLYARVDGVETPDGFMLMELELIEPSLYLEHDKSAAARFAAAIAAQL